MECLQQALLEYLVHNLENDPALLVSCLNVVISCYLVILNIKKKEHHFLD